MAQPHPFASASPRPQAGTDAAGLMQAEHGDEAFGFECAVPCLQIDSWAAEQGIPGVGNAESASRPL
jgi:hypothetical protein